MIPSFVLSLREGLEAALIIGIVLGALRKTGRTDLDHSLWLGVISASVLSLLTAFLLRGIGAELTGRAEEIFEGLTLLLAAGVLTWMIIWMSKQTRSMGASLESDVNRAVQHKGQGAIFFLAFIAVLREGIELALYLTAASLTSSGLQTLVGTLLGLSVSGLLGFLIFNATLRLNLKRFFQITAFILILFAAGLIAHSIAEFNEAGIIPTVVNQVYNLNPYLNDQSSLGMIFNTLFGYYGSPSLSQIMGYIGYLLAIGFLFIKSRKFQLG
jgi:high-affinity iron transporter